MSVDWWAVPTLHGYTMLNFDSIDNLTGTSNDGILDANGKLKDTYRSGFLGTHGWEIQ